MLGVLYTKPFLGPPTRGLQGLPSVETLHWRAPELPSAGATRAERLFKLCARLMPVVQINQLAGCVTAPTERQSSHYTILNFMVHTALPRSTSRLTIAGMWSSGYSSFLVTQVFYGLQTLHGPGSTQAYSYWNPTLVNSLVLVSGDLFGPSSP